MTKGSVQEYTWEGKDYVEFFRGQERGGMAGKAGR